MSSSQDRSSLPLWISPLLVALAWWALLTTNTEGNAEMRSNLLFLGAPLLLLSGLHARLEGYLHDPERLRWLPLPLTPLEHWTEAHRLRRRGLWITAAVGLAATVAATAPLGAVSLQAAMGWLWFCVIAAILEPIIAGVGAYGGRRFTQGHGAADLQRAMGGGWTSPEAVVHLYGPAFGVALIALLAMPAQLALEHTATGHPVSAAAWSLVLSPLLVAVALRVAAARLYARGLWEAAPWLAETIRTLAGPALPERAPRWLPLLGTDPLRRLYGIQFARLTSAPWLRLIVLLGFALHLALREGTPPSAPLMALGLCIVGLWLLPLRAQRRQRRQRALLCAALPLPAAARRGVCRSALPHLLAPPLLLVSIPLLRWTIGDG